MRRLVIFGADSQRGRLSEPYRCGVLAFVLVKAVSVLESGHHVVL